MRLKMRVNDVLVWIVCAVFAFVGVVAAADAPTSKPDIKLTPLVEAVQSGPLEVARQLLDAGADVSEPSSNGQTPLGAAAAGGNVAMIRLLVERGANVELAVPPTFVPLAQAARAGRIEAMDALIELGANVNGRNATGLVPLHSAAVRNQVEAIKLLLAKGAKVDARSERYQTPLMSAAGAGSMDAARLLLDNGADASENNGGGRSAVGMAAEKGSWDIVMLLLDRGAPVNAEMNHESSLTTFAAAQGKVSELKELFRRGAKVNPNESPLAKTVKNGHTATAALLIEHGAELPAHEFPEVLRRAADAGFGELALMLVRAQRRWDGLPPEGEQEREDALLTAATAGDVAAVTKVMQGPPLRRTDVLDAALRIAEKKSHADVLKLIRPAAEPAIIAARKLAEKNKALVNECMEPCRTERVAALLADGAQAAAYDDSSSAFSALFWASRCGNLDVVKMLLEHGAAVNFQRGARETPLRGAAGEGHVEVVKLLLSRGADPNLVDASGFAPLNTAAFNGKREVVDLLIAAKAYVDHARFEQVTPLMDAAERGHADVVRALLRAGANPNLKNESGATALSLAQANSKVEVVRLLEKAGVTAGGGRPPVDVITLIPKGMLGVRQWLDAGGNPNEMDPHLYATPLRHVIDMPGKMAEDERLAIAILLIERGADASQPGLLGSAIYARRDVAMLKLLVKHGADVNSARGWAGGYTPLLLAAEFGTAEQVKYLLDVGAEAGVRLHSGRTAIDLLQERRRPDPKVNELIESAVTAAGMRPVNR
jgi:ankyrin repeat protein